MTALPRTAIPINLMLRWPGLRTTLRLKFGRKGEVRRCFVCCPVHNLWILFAHLNLAIFWLARWGELTLTFSIERRRPLFNLGLALWLHLNLIQMRHLRRRRRAVLIFVLHFSFEGVVNIIIPLSIFLNCFHLSFIDTLCEWPFWWLEQEV